MKGRNCKYSSLISYSGSNKIGERQVDYSDFINGDAVFMLLMIFISPDILNLQKNTIWYLSPYF